MPSNLVWRLRLLVTRLIVYSSMLAQLAASQQESKQDVNCNLEQQLVSQQVAGERELPAQGEGRCIHAHQATVHTSWAACVCQPAICVSRPVLAHVCQPAKLSCACVHMHQPATHVDQFSTGHSLVVGHGLGIGNPWSRDLQTQIQLFKRFKRIFFTSILRWQVYM